MAKFKTRKREVRYFLNEICIDGHWFEMDDLVETLEAVEEDTTFVSNYEMVEVLVKRKVLLHGGSYKGGYGAQIGPNFKKFLARMKEYKKEMTLCED